MKTPKIFKAILASVAIGLSMLAAPAQATISIAYTGDLVNTQVCLDSTAVVDLNSYNVGYLSFQTIYSSQAFSNSTFTDGRAATGSITVASNTNFTNNKATNSVTLGSTSALASAKATNTITITSNTAVSGSVLTVNGTQIIEGRDWTRTATATGTAVALKNVLDTFPGMDAAAASTVVYTTAAVAGLGGNSFTMTSSTQAALTVGSANFTGGREQALTNAILTVNGTPYRAGYLWVPQDTSSGTATNIAALLNQIGGVACSTTGSGGLVVICTATASGSAANAFTLASSTPSAMTVNSATYTGGRDTTTVTINGVVLTNGSDWATGATSSATAKNISDAIAANSSLNGIIVSTWNASAVVTSTASISGTAGNYVMTTNNSGSLTVAGFSGGSGPSWVVNTPTITITGHGYSLGTAVLYSTGAVAITGLTNQTTYYVTPIDANNIKLSSSKANVAAGTYIVLASSVANGQHTYTLAPVGISGSASWKWQESNDNSNWADLSVSSVTFSTPFTASQQFWDFGQVNPRYLRLNFTSPTFGCVNLRAKGNGK